MFNSFSCFASAKVLLISDMAKYLSQ